MASHIKKKVTKIPSKIPDRSLKLDNYASRARRPHQMGRTRRKEKQSARTVRPKTLHAKGYKKRRREIREDFSRKEMTMQGPKNKG
jgi:hypothetical protein